MNTLSRGIVSRVTKLFKEKLPEHRKPELKANLKRNFYFPISAILFFSLNSTSELGYSIGMLIALSASLLIASQIPSIFTLIKKESVGLHVITAMTTLSICWHLQSAFYAELYTLFQELLPESIISVPIVPAVVSVGEAVFTIFFIYFFVMLFWKKMTKIFSDSNIFSDINKAEVIVYGVLIIAALAFMVVSFAKTEVFYKADNNADIIYTSDSQILMMGNVYMNLTHPENDLRQPLFAVFAAPFVGIPYLFGRLFGASECIKAILVNMVQIIMMFAANFMLAKMMKLNSVKRICLMLLTSFTYTHMLFTLMMEQYIIAYFWLILCMYQISEKRSPDKLVMWGTGGTLLTGMILLPFMSDKNPIKNFKNWFADMLKYGFEFIVVMLVFCRFDVIFDIKTKIISLSHFTGKSVEFSDKIYQYTAFVSNCFIAPNADVADNKSWQLNPAASINFIGIAILLLAIISTVLNRDKKSSLLAGGWAAFSVVMLLCLGWGTVENGLILYSLYFGWAFLVLLFQLVEKLEDKLKVKFLVPVFSIGCAVGLAIINIPGVMDMLDFAVTRYPS